MSRRLWRWLVRDLARRTLQFLGVTVLVGLLALGEVRFLQFGIPPGDALPLPTALKIALVCGVLVGAFHTACFPWRAPRART